MVSGYSGRHVTEPQCKRVEIAVISLNRTVVVNVMAVLFFGIGLFIASSPDYDVWWHSQVGRDICRDGIWPSPDLYSYATDKVWVIHSWLAGCFFYIVWTALEQVHHGLGETALKGTRLILLSAFTLCAYFVARRHTRNETVAITVALCAASLSWIREIRPFLFTPLFMLYMYSFFGRRNPSTADWYFLPVAMLLWANLHGGFVLASVLMLSTVILHALVSLLPYDRYHSRKWLILSLMGVVATCINPAPLELLNRVYHIRNDPTSDWYSLLWWFRANPADTWGNLLIYLAAFGVWGYALWRGDSRSGNWLSARFLLELACFILAARHIRFLWMLVIPMLASCERFRKLVHPSQHIHWAPILLLFIVMFIQQDPVLQTGFRRLPKESMDYFVEEGLQGNVFAPWQWGGYITWRSDRKAQVFVDTRIEPFSRRQIQLSWRATIMPARHLGELSKCGTQFIIMPANLSRREYTMLSNKGLIRYLSKNEHNFLAKLSCGRIREIYGEGTLESEVRHDANKTSGKS